PSFFYFSALHQFLHSFPTRRSSDLIAGYPWFGDWGRDTFIALRGLCIATGRLEEARDILLQWADTVSQGMLPNRFPDNGEQPERSEEHTSELQSRFDLVCRLLLEKK